MSSDGISALERGHRRSPQRETLALLARALALSAGQRQEFEAAAARPSMPRRGASVTVGPWPDDSRATLPFALTSFVGRKAELAEVAALVRAHRLVTITGAGGVGKTQTALRVAKEFNVTDNVALRFVGLAPVRDPSLLVAITASALNVQKVPDRSLLATVIAYLKSRAMLLIFDNCEHVISEAANLIGALLSECPQVRVLATSRESLNTAGGYTYRLPSLDSSSAMMLFGDRAHAADARFVPADDTGPIVAEICRRLDGIPLAIELAAARVKILSLKTLAEKLDDRFRILTGGDRAALPRQQTMRATIEWSYDLLAPQERRLFARLGVFSGTFSLGAVMAVCGEGLDESVFDLLASLTEKSLVVADISGTQERYRLLESTGAYALEKLQHAGECERMACRHAKYFRDQAEAADERYGAGSTIAWLAGVEPELDNYRAALEWALSRGNDAVLGGAIAGALDRLWWDATLVVEGRYWIELAVKHLSEGEQPAIAGRLQSALSVFPDGGSCEAAQRAMQLYESVGDARGAARAQRRRGWAVYRMGRLDEARETVALAVAASRECCDTWNVANALRQLAYIETSRGDFRAGRELYAQALAAMKALENELGTALVLGDMAESEFAAGDPAEALRLAEAALELVSLGKNSTLSAQWHNAISAFRIALGDLAEARASAREALRLAQGIQDELVLTWILQHFALLAALSGDSRSAAQLLGYVEARYNHLRMKREPTQSWIYEKLLAVLQETLKADDIKTLLSEGRAWSDGQAVAEALKV